MRNQSGSRRRLAMNLAAASVVGLAHVPALYATSYTWNNTSGGSWFTSANWTPTGTPSLAADLAIFNSAAAYTVTLGSNPSTITGVSFNAGTVQLASSAGTRTLNLTGFFTDSGATANVNVLNVNATSNITIQSGGVMNVTGSALTFQYMNLGQTGNGTLLLDSSSLNCTSTIGTVMGQNGGTANFTLQNASTATFNGILNLANSSTVGTNATLMVNGTSSVVLNGGLQMIPSPQAGQAATFSVNNSASVTQTGGNGMILGALNNSTGTAAVLLNGGTFTTGTSGLTAYKDAYISLAGGTLTMNGPLTLNGGALRYLSGTFNPAGSIAVSNGGTLTYTGTLTSPNTSSNWSVDGSGSVMSLGAVTITKGSTLSAGTLSSGAALRTGNINVGTNLGAGTFLVEGATTSFTGSNVTVNVGSGGNATALFSTGAAVSINTVNVASQTGTTSSFMMDTGATATAQALTIVSTGGTATTTLSNFANFNVPTFVYIGSTSGNASLNMNSATLTTSSFQVDGTTAHVTQTAGTINGGSVSLQNGANWTASAGTINASYVSVNGGASMGLAYSANLSFTTAASQLNINSGGTVSIGAVVFPGDSTISVYGSGSSLSFPSYGQTGQLMNVTGGASVVGSEIDLPTPGNWNINGSTFVADNSYINLSPGTSTVTFSNHSSGTWSSYAIFGEDINGLPGVNAVLNVYSGSTVNAGTLYMLHYGFSGGSAAINVSGAGSTLNVSGSLVFNTNTAASGSLTLKDNASGSIANLTFPAGATITLDSSYLTISALNTAAAGTLNFVSGQLTIPAACAGTSVNTIYRDSFSLSSGQNLVVNGTTTIDPFKNITLNGGSLTTISLVNNGSLYFNSGKLSITGVSGVAVGSGGPLGSIFNLSTNQTLNVSSTLGVNSSSVFNVAGGNVSAGAFSNSGQTNVSSGIAGFGASVTNNTGASLTLSGGMMTAFNLNNSGTLTLSGGNASFGGGATIGAGSLAILTGGSLSATSAIINNGEIRMASVASLVSGGPITNNKLIDGNGYISNSITNASTGEIRAANSDRLTLSGSTNTNNGKVTLSNGGTVEFSNALTNSSTGNITGRGTLIASSISNSGKMNFSGGFTDVYGSVTNNSGGSIIVTGGGTTTFWNPLTNATGANIQVSTNSTAVFEGLVSGSGSFSGAGTKIFDAGGGPSVIPALATVSGSTTVESGAAVNVKTLNENSLTVRGSMTIATKSQGGTTAVLSGLEVDSGGTLDLTNNAVVVNYSNTSPVAGLRAAIASAYDGDNGGTWDLPGITSSNAAADQNYMTGVGYAEASDVAVDQGGSWEGQTINGEAVLMKYTYYGDSNLDGVVTTDDYFAFVAGFNGQGSGWAYGDYNYDGVIDTTDLFIFVPVFNSNTENNPLSSLILSDGDLSASQKAALLSVVPEPASVGMLAMGAAAMGIRRRRKA